MRPLSMRFRLMVATIVAGICAFTLVSAGGAGSEERAATEDIIRSVDVRLDRRCQVAVFEISLTRDAPLGLRLVGRVPFGPQRIVALPAKAPVGQSAQARLLYTEVWDLVFVNGGFLRPGTHHGRLRAFDAKREQVIDTFPVTLKLPKSFYKRSLDRCGG